MTKKSVQIRLIVKVVVLVKVPYQHPGNAVIGGGFEDFTFTEEQTGPIIIRFEKIAGTSAVTQFAIIVAPEFGPLAILILILTMSFIIILRSYPKILLK